MLTLTLTDFRGNVIRTEEFADIDAANAAVNAHSEGPDCGLNFYEWDEKVIGQCEMCNQLYLRTDEVKDEETGNSGFCSDDCMLEAVDEVRVGRYEASREYAMYGNDYDSWYR